MANLFYLLPGAALGAILSYIIPFLVGAFRSLVRVVRHQRTLEGDWFSYHYTKQSHQPRVRQMRWKIKQDFRGHFTTICRGEDIDPARSRPPTKQRGTATLERGHLLITVFSRENHVHSTCLIPEPIAFNETSAGLWLGFDLDGRLTTGPIIFTRETLDLGKAESLLKSCISARSAFRILESAKVMRSVAEAQPQHSHQLGQPPGTSEPG